MQATTLTTGFRRIDNKTLEFDLRTDIKFHNGNQFNAADVKTTVDYLIDPKVNIRFKERYTWVERVEVLGGKLEILSELGEGTRITATLPLQVSA